MSNAVKRIHLTTNGVISRLEVGGADISSLAQAIRFSHEAGNLPKVVVELSIVETVVDGEAVLLIPDATRNALVSLGWTPPQD